MILPKYSVLVSTRNEGGALRRTVDSVVDQAPGEGIELIVVDDASEDGSTGFLEGGAYRGVAVELARNTERKGLIFSRAEAARRARGRCLAFLDAHCLVDPRWLEELDARLDAIGGRGIAIPVTHSLDAESWTIERESLPCVACSITNPFLDFGWVDAQLVDGRPCTCAIGGMAWLCTREWYDHIGGLDDEMEMWGGENTDIALRTWVAGGWCVVARDAVIGHRYKENAKEPIDEICLLRNKIRAAHSVFGRETLHRILENMSVLDGFSKALAQLWERPGRLSQLKDHIEAVRQRSDQWIIETFRLPLFEQPAFYCCTDGVDMELDHVESVIRKHRRRPPVSVLLITRAEAHASRTLSSLLGKTTYKNADVVLLSSEKMPAGTLEETEFSDHPRVRRIHAPGAAGDLILENLGAFSTDAEYFALLDERVLIVDPHWIEECLVLFERRPRLAMVCPRTVEVSPDASPEGMAITSRSDAYDGVWDWQAPGFTRIRRGQPVARHPYQAFTCPSGLLFLRRAAFVTLGGFDGRLADRQGRITDFAVRAWLSGWEVFCHPGVRCGVMEPDAGLASGEHHESLYSATDASQIVMPLKCFSNRKRILECYRRTPRAPLVLQGAFSRLEVEKRRFLQDSKYDDDWLFCKFGIEPPPPSSPAGWSGHVDGRGPSDLSPGGDVARDDGEVRDGERKMEGP